MLRIRRRRTTAFEHLQAADLRLDEDIVWIELLNPTRDEELAVERAVGVEVPTREDMQEIEQSSRLYKRDGAAFMTALVISRTGAEDSIPQAQPITFILVDNRLVTVRYAEPKSFTLFEAQAAREPELCADGKRVFLGLLEAIIDRIADILEETGADVKAIARQIFRPSRTRRFEAILKRLGVEQHLNVLAHESLISLSRIVSFARLVPQIEDDRLALEQLRSQARDVDSLIEHSGYIANTIAFQLDAALGLIGIEQNDINKVFSIAAVLFMPPTLIAGVYGMNFKILPELNWRYGYPMALGMMLVSVLLGLLWIRRKGWL